MNPRKDVKVTKKQMTQYIEYVKSCGYQVDTVSIGPIVEYLMRGFDKKQVDMCAYESNFEGKIEYYISIRLGEMV